MFLKDFVVKKCDGSLERYNPRKLENSLIRSGATRKIAREVVAQVDPIIFDQITTKQIYNKAFKIFWKKSRFDATTYNLKKSILGLGPAGFHFETFMAHIFKAKGYRTVVGATKKGCCVTHEVDIVAKRPDFTIFAECKFHNAVGKKNDIKAALYIHARSLDLHNSEYCEKFDEFWFVTNTSFSKDAIKYAECVGLQLFSLNFPKNKTIGDIVTRYKLHPITCLRSLNKNQQRILLDRGYILCKEVLRNHKVLQEIGIDTMNTKKILSEIKLLVNR